MYRGWYNGAREFGSAPVPGVLHRGVECPVLGDRAYQVSEREKADVRWEASSSAPAGPGPLGLPTPVATRASTSCTGASSLHHRQLAVLPRLGPVGQLAVGARTASGS